MPQTEMHIVKTCSVDGCAAEMIARVLCHKHYKRWQTHGNPLTYLLKHQKGEGHITANGYWKIVIKGKEYFKHVLILRNVLGVDSLPVGAEIHHINGDGTNNKNTNLVLCDSKKYHLFLHTRHRAFDSCGHANWRKCVYCHEYDDPCNMYISPKLPMAYHRKCKNKDGKNRYEKQRKVNLCQTMN